MDNRLGTEQNSIWKLEENNISRFIWYNSHINNWFMQENTLRKPFNILIHIDLPHSEVESISFNKEVCGSADTSPRVLGGRVLEGTWGDM